MRFFSGNCEGGVEEDTAIVEDEIDEDEEVTNDEIQHRNNENNNQPIISNFSPPGCVRPVPCRDVCRGCLPTARKSPGHRNARDGQRSKTGVDRTGVQARDVQGV